MKEVVLYGSEDDPRMKIMADYRARVVDAMGKDWRETPCWTWPVSKNRGGYGVFTLDGKAAKAHRVAYFLATGVQPGGLCVCHHCDNPGCVNPAHLFLGTIAENAADRETKGRGITPGLCGEQHGMSKLTEQTVRAIRIAPGTQREIARQYGIHPSIVSLIKRRKTWRHVK